MNIKEQLRDELHLWSDRDIPLIRLALAEIERLEAVIERKDGVLRDIASFSSRIFSEPHRPMAAVNEKATRALAKEPSNG